MAEDTLATRQKNLADALGIPVGLIGSTEDPEETMQRIMEEIASQSTAEGVLKSGVAVSAEDVLHQALMLRDFRWQSSDYGDVPFAVVDAVDTNGQPVTFVCGGRKVIVKLAQIRKLNGFPVAAMLTSKEIELADGGRGKVYDLVPA